MTASVLSIGFIELMTELTVWNFNNIHPRNFSDKGWIFISSTRTILFISFSNFSALVLWSSSKTFLQPCLLKNSLSMPSSLSRFGPKISSSHCGGFGCFVSIELVCFCNCFVCSFSTKRSFWHWSIKQLFLVRFKTWSSDKVSFRLNVLIWSMSKSTKAALSRKRFEDVYFHLNWNDIREKFQIWS